MKTSERTGIISANSRGFNFEDALADPSLTSYQIFTSALLPGQLQTPDYTRAVLKAISNSGLPMFSDPEVEPEARFNRSQALLADRRVEKIIAIPKDALRLRIGTTAVSLAALHHARSVVEDSIQRPDLTIALFYKPGPGIYDPPTSFDFGDFSIIRTATAGTRAFYDDELSEAEPGSLHHEWLQAAGRVILERDDTVTGAEAAEEFDQAISELTREA